MKYQLLVSTMNKKDFSLVEEMKIDSDAIIINQADKVDYTSIEKDNNKIEMYTFNERGIGLSRNTAFMRSDADIIEFADDDMIFVDNYEKLVMNEFTNHKDADAIIFSVESLNMDRPMHRIQKFKRIHAWEGRKYGCARLAIRKNCLLYKNISFSLLFGGGAKYGAGEDTLMISSLLKAGLRVYVSPVKVADVKQDESSWFSGYNEKFYTDKGALMCAMYPQLCGMIAVFFAFYHAGFKYQKYKELHTYYKNGIDNFRSHK